MGYCVGCAFLWVFVWQDLYGWVGLGEREEKKKKSAFVVVVVSFTIFDNGNNWGVFVCAFFIIQPLLFVITFILIIATYYATILFIFFSVSSKVIEKLSFSSSLTLSTQKLLFFFDKLLE